MRLLVDVIRGMKVENALNFLKYNTQHPSTPLEKLLRSAISNWQVKNESEDIDDLIEAVGFGNRSINEFEASCFTGDYVTGDVDTSYLDRVERRRSDRAKIESSDKGLEGPKAEML